MSIRPTDLSSPKGGLSRVALKGTAATGIAQILRVALQMMLTIVLARLLTPADFGLVAMVAPVVAFATLFQEFGLQQAVIQSSDITQSQLTRLFWLNVGLSVLVSLALVLTSPYVADFYAEERVRALTAACAVPLILGALGAQHQALLSRASRFVTIAAIESAATTASFIIAVGAAFVWQSYWALWLSTAVSAAVVSICAWISSGWRPGVPWAPAKVGPLLNFGANLTGFSFLNFFSRNLDNVIVARFAGAEALGFYDRAYKLLLFPLQNINQPVTRVMVPLLSRLQFEPDRLRRGYIAAAGAVTLTSVPGVAAATACSPEIVRLLLGEEWLPTASIFTWLGIAGLMQPLGNTTGWLFIAQGRTREMLHWGIYSSLITVASFLIGIQWGTVGLAASYAISGWVLRLPILCYKVSRIGPVTARDLIMLQLPLTLAAASIWPAAQMLRQSSIEDELLIVVCLFLSYTIAMLTQMCHQQGRENLSSSLNMLRSKIVK